MKIIKIPLPKVKNNYIFSIYDEKDNLVEEKTFHNICMSKRYFADNANHLYLSIGTMTDNDYKKYQEMKSDGLHWKDGWAVKPSGQGEQASNGLVNDGVSHFKGKTSINDTSLWGTQVKTLDLKWSNNIENQQITLTGVAEWGYHNPNDSLLSQDIKEGYQITKGIVLTDAGLCGGRTVWSGILYTHFPLNITKRPINKIKITIEIIFEINDINFMGFNNFIKEGNALYAQNNGHQYYNNTVEYCPTKLSISPFPIKLLNDGVIPIDSCISKDLNTIYSEKPLDWDTYPIPLGNWYGFPKYYYFGKWEKEWGTSKPDVVLEPNPYETKIEIKDNKKYEVYKYDDIKHTKIIDKDKLKPIHFYYYNENCGTINSLVLGNHAATELVDNQEITLRLGIGDGKQKIFYHPFNSLNCSGLDNIGYTGNIYDTLPEIDGIYFNEQFFGLAYGEGEGWTDRLYKNSIPNDKTNILKDKSIQFALSPFDGTNYYTWKDIDRNLLINTMCIFKNFKPTYVWAGLSGSYSIGGGDGNVDTITIRASKTLNGLVTYGEYQEQRVDASRDQHEPTKINIDYSDCNYVGISINYSNHYGCYSGGVNLDHYNISGARFSTSLNNENNIYKTINGYIEFPTAPSLGQPIEIKATISKPFVTNTSSFDCKYCFVCGDKEDNGEASAEVLAKYWNTPV